MFKNKVIALILEEANLMNSQIRNLEDQCNKFSVDLFDNHAYIAARAYRLALQDLLSKIRSMDESG